MQPHITITPATTDDAPVITQLSVTTFSETFAHLNTFEDMDLYLKEEMNPEKIKGELEDAKNFFFISGADNMPVGYIKMRRRNIGNTNGEALEIERLYVLKKYHNKKAGAMLMQYSMNFALQQGCKILWLGVWEHNHRAIGFYTRFGFNPFGTHIFRLGTDDQTDILMKKEL